MSQFIPFPGHPDPLDPLDPPIYLLAASIIPYASCHPVTLTFIVTVPPTTTGAVLRFRSLLDRVSLIGGPIANRTIDTLAAPLNSFYFSGLPAGTITALDAYFQLLLNSFLAGPVVIRFQIYTVNPVSPTPITFLPVPGTFAHIILLAGPVYIGTRGNALNT